MFSTRSIEEVKQEREVDASGQVYLTIAELQEQERRRCAGASPFCTISLGCAALALVCTKTMPGDIHSSCMCQADRLLRAVRHNLEPGSDSAPPATNGAAAAAAEETTESDEEEEGSSANWSFERRTAEELVKFELSQHPSDNHFKPCSTRCRASSGAPQRCWCAGSMAPARLDGDDVALATALDNSRSRSARMGARVKRHCVRGRCT